VLSTISNITNCLISSKATVSLTSYILHWISSFVKDRYQCVAIENCFSSVAKIIGGVPQSSLLDPILFIIFINDIDSVSLSIDILMFAFFVFWSENRHENLQLSGISKLHTLRECYTLKLWKPFKIWNVTVVENFKILQTCRFLHYFELRKLQPFMEY